MSVAIQPADSLHGQLQRGRGIAARRAAVARGAGELVYDCVRRDPRWDRETETRGLFYARLIVDLELSVDPLADHLFDPRADVTADEWRTGLTIDVLADLVRLSRRTAAAPLRRYTKEGRNWSWALSALVALDDPVLVDGLDEIAVARCDDDDLLWLVDPEGRVSRAWAARHPRVADALQARAALRAAARRRGSRPTMADHSDADLAAAGRRLDYQSCGAILELGRRHSEVVLDLAEELLPIRPHWCGGPLSRAIHDLGALAVPRARRWVMADDGRSDVGVGVLARHGTAQDIPALLHNLAVSIRGRQWNAATDPALGLGRLGAARAVPLLRAAWGESTHARLRSHVLTALTRISPRAAEPYSTEGLWDCEEDTRRRAIATAPLDEDVRLRLRRLSAEDAEAPDLRSAAAARLGQK